jgi:hypothetical protein
MLFNWNWTGTDVNFVYSDCALANIFANVVAINALASYENIGLNTTSSLLSVLRSSIAPQSVRFGVRSRKLSNVAVGQSLDGWPKIYYLELLRASEGTLSRWSLLHLQSLAPTNPHWARVVGYGPFSLCVIHKESLCLSSGDINNRLMMSWGERLFGLSDI